MKKLIAGVGLTVLAVPAAQAWTGSMDEMRTMQANESRPIVRIQRYQVDTVSCGQCHIRQHRTHAPQHRRAHQATGWQRSARVIPYGMSQRQHAPRQPMRQAHPVVRPVMMHAYYAPYRQPAAQHPPRIHRIVGQAPPMCRYIR